MILLRHHNRDSDYSLPGHLDPFTRPNVTMFKVSQIRMVYLNCYENFAVSLDCSYIPV